MLPTPCGAEPAARNLTSGQSMSANRTAPAIPGDAEEQGHALSAQNPHLPSRHSAGRSWFDWGRRAPGESDNLADVRVRERNSRRGLALADMLAAAGSVLVAISLLGGDRLRAAYLLILPLIVVVAKIQGLYDRDELLVRK